MADADWYGGLPPEIDYMLPGKPADPDMRESASIWLFEENGEFAFPRIGIEAIGKVWENHRYDCNFAFAGGRALFDITTDGKTHSPIGPDGKPAILGSGGLTFECIEPFRKWRVAYQGTPIDTTSAAMIARTVDPAKKAAVSFDVDITMAMPGWVQDNRPEKLAAMTERERTDAGLMGFGWRVEHQFRAEGTLSVDGRTRRFKGTGNRIHRQSVRPLEAFRGHCWLAALFPDGRAFGLIAYPPAEDGTTYNDGYIYQNGRMYPVKVTKIPFLSELKPEGDDVSFELESELGVTRISGVTALSTFKAGIAEMPGFTLQQGSAKFTWDDQTAWGMVERSSWADQLKT